MGYRFNGKELDEETGLAYYGARYYDNQLSMWLSVDPLAHEYRSLSPGETYIGCPAEYGNQILDPSLI
ncbi:hypothetical protein OAP05_03345 [Schleiferiaceae bacterium]|nr:hypothetical protein [Schleiferiaceae bacterium]MDC0614917.1 hypothetical protein [Schleiferiaceae bacterium]MDC6481700.1 hypothetical protein [Schleiferiaceae bacterium]